MTRDDYRFNEKTIEFFDYEFKCSYVYRNRIIKVSDIVEAEPDFIPPALRIKQGELIFFSREDKEELRKFAQRNSVAIVDRLDVWFFILEEFLDTEFDEDFIQMSYERLNSCGISKEECDRLRSEVHDRMWAYNVTSGLWEWIYLGLVDLLRASVSEHVPGGPFLNDEEFKEFYFRAMDIAYKGTIIDK